MNLPIITPNVYRLAAQAIAVMLVVVAALAWWHSHNASQQQIGYDKANAEWNAWKASADAKANQDAITRIKQKETAQNEAAQRQLALEKIAGSLRADRDRMRNENAALHTRIGTLAIDAARRVAEAGVTIFGECAERYSTVAIAADQCYSERQTLMEAWPK